MNLQILLRVRCVSIKQRGVAVALFVDPGDKKGREPDIECAALQVRSSRGIINFI